MAREPRSDTARKYAKLHGVNTTWGRVVEAIDPSRGTPVRVCVQPPRAQVDNHRTNVDFGHCSNSTSRLIASTDACFELASIGGPPAPRPGARPGLPRRARAAADMLPVCHFDAQVRPCLCAAGLMCMLRLRAAHSPIDATLLEHVMSFRILSIYPLSISKLVASKQASDSQCAVPQRA